mmetsp:Transcript_31919/g.65102  ORF Transcript_31919/g.65102 Transcript_31919/m.65102 type:complete len:841 (-) Transcript_31919:700-3222(-)
MPSLTILGSLNTRPFAGDDLQILSLVQGFFRILQLCCLVIPLAANYYFDYSSGRNLTINGIPPWCPAYHDKDVGGYLILTIEDRENTKIERIDNTGIIIILSFFSVFIDLAWAGAVWSAASVGTPTETTTRDGYLRPLLWSKIFIINLFPAILFSYGIYAVDAQRRNNYGCGDEEPIYYPDDSVWFLFYSILIVSYAFELLIWAAVLVNKIVAFLRGPCFFGRSSARDKVHRYEILVGNFLRCLSLCYCFKKGGKNIKNRGELRDAAYALTDYVNNDTKMDIVFSDLYVGLKLLARIQKERRLDAMKHIASIAASFMSEEGDNDEGAEHVMNRESFLKSTLNKCSLRVMHSTRNMRSSVLTIQSKPLSEEYEVIERAILSNDNDNDRRALADGAHFVPHSVHIYHKIGHAVHDHPLCVHNATFAIPIDSLNDDRFYLKSIHGQESTKLIFASFLIGIHATVYAILADEVAKAIVISVRGTLSLEDVVVDLQCLPQELSEVGRKCDFEGSGHYCHSGILSRGKWMYEDIRKRRILHEVFSRGSPYENYDLVIVGHSLGAGCACILATMIRHKYPRLRCFAFEPPGCVYDEALCNFSESFITSFVRHDDIVPRLAPANADALRDEFFELLARVKIPKFKLFRDIRDIVNDDDLSRRNLAVLRATESTPRDTQYYQQLLTFRNERTEKDISNRSTSTKLYIPGKIIHLCDVNGDGSFYIPYWATRCEFNEIILSERMISDHSASPLVDILKNIRLDELYDSTKNHSMKFQNQFELIQDDNSHDQRRVVCFSTRQCGRNFVLSSIVTIAILLSFLVNNGCEFFYREAVVSRNGEKRNDPSTRIG